MPQQPGTNVTVDASFQNGLITEATGLNFPEAACTETYDCEFTTLGAVKRRLGFDFERNYITKVIERTGQAINTYLWKNVGGNGDVTVLVLQVGQTLHFYETNTSGNYSLGEVPPTVTLSPAPGATDSQVETIEAQFCDGNGLLFVTHQHCDPIRISYDVTANTATATSITIQIRDFEGATADPYAVDFRPTSTLAALETNHKYNLYNQGWRTAELTAWDAAQTTMPSNVDVMWAFTNISDTTDKTFSASSADIAGVIAGNTPAPKGHFILNLSDMNREGVTEGGASIGTTGVAHTTTSIYRPSTAAFFAGRIFYSGVNYVGFNSKIYFSQIVERPEQYEQCYQTNDPTSQDLFDLLPSDGGVISIPDAGTIVKLIAIPGGLCIFAHRGVWFVTGSSGIGFQATDYTIQRIATVETLSATSFVITQSYSAGTPIEGGKSNYIAWWNAEGVYSMSVGTNQFGIQSLPLVDSMTDKKIRTFFGDIPLASKRYARGFYHPLDRHIRWVYRSEGTTQLTNVYEYDRVLSYNTLTGAWYPWTISDTNVKVHGIVATDLLSKAITTLNVVDSIPPTDNVIDSLGDQVIVFSDPGVSDPYFDKYIVSYLDAGDYHFTFADKTNADYVDWQTFDDVGEDYTSYFIFGYKIRGEALRKFRNNWVRIYNNLTSDGIAYYFQAIWDFAKTGDGTGKWSVKQLVAKTSDLLSATSTKLKVRGHGNAVQFRVESVPGEPFHIIGWAAEQPPNIKA